MLKDILAIPDTHFWMRFFVATFCGLVFGLERQIRGKPFGLKTCIMICLGTATFVAVGVKSSVLGGDPGRVLAQVVSGIGFLGAGAILSHGGLVRGITSAAVIWVLAAVGSAVGLEYYGEAVWTTLCGVLILYVFEQAERNVKILQKGVHRQKEHERVSESNR